jgi:hypothetical protein
MKPAVIAILLLLSTKPSQSAGDEMCGQSNTTFAHGERLTFKVFYSVIGIYVDAGTGHVRVEKERYNNKGVYHIVAEGFSNPSYDWIFKVRDRYETYIDTVSLRPYKFVRNVEEGNYRKFENLTFNHEVRTATSEKGVIPIPACVHDVISAVYNARNINYDKYKPDDKIPFSMIIDDEVFNLSIRYMGREAVRTRYGKFRAIRLKLTVIKGNVFEGGEKMDVWVSDDANHIPLRVESPISVGSVKADMMAYHNLRYPLSSRISANFE